jgi:integrase
MNVANELNGTQIALQVPTSSPSAQTDVIVPNTIADLLKRLEQEGTKGLPMLRTACGVLATYLSTTIDRLTIQAVFDGKDSFRAYLVGRKYAENSIRTYVNQANILLNGAKEYGWAPADDVPPAWNSMMARGRRASWKIRKSLVKYLIAIRPTPLAVTDEDTIHWAESKVKEGFSIANTNTTVRWFWQTLNKLGLADTEARQVVASYKVPVDEFPSPLKSEVRELLKWKQADFSPGRPSEGKHRPVTAKSLEHVICRLYGYALNVRHEAQIKCLADLVQEHVVTGFAEWRINERHNGGYGVRIGLSMLRAALRHHPVHRNIDLTWFDRLLDSIPQESESAQRRRKAEKFLEYTVVERIPEQIHQDRLKLRTSSAEASQLVMDELLIKWLAILPWRQRNLRECRVSGPEPNLFKSTIPAVSELKKPDWLLLEEQRNPSAQFWQFRFAPDEVKTKVPIHSLLPKQLVPLLEEYLSAHRPTLLGGNYCEKLFVNRRGGAMDDSTMTEAVGALTLRYAGRRVSPHRFRDIVAYAWLDAHPEDYLRLSKLLWHRNVATTIQIYGARFNESNGVCAMEAWLDERKARSTSK